MLLKGLLDLALVLRSNLARRLEYDAFKFEVGLYAREVLEYELLTHGLIDLAVCKSQALQLLPLEFLLQLIHQVEPKHPHEVA